MCRRIAWSWSISEGVSIDVSSNTGGMVEALLKLEYRLIKGVCLLEIAIDRPGACSSNTLLVCVIGLLLSSAAAAAAVNLFVCCQFVYLLFENTNSYPPLSLLLVAPIMK